NLVKMLSFLLTPNTCPTPKSICTRAPGTCVQLYAARQTKTLKCGGGLSDVVRQSRERWKTCTGLSNSQTNLPTHEVGNRQCRAKRSVAMRRGMAHSVTLSDKIGRAH